MAKTPPPWTIYDDTDPLKIGIKGFTRKLGGLHVATVIMPENAQLIIVRNRDSLRVTDHAVLRYMERVMELNVDLVRQHIADLCAGPAAIGAVCVRAEGFRFEIANGADNSTVTTVRPDRVTPGATTKQRNQRFIERQGPAT